MPQSVEPELLKMLNPPLVCEGPLVGLILMDPQLNSRNFFQTISAEDVGTYRYPGFPWKFSETQFRVTHPPCRVGEDNEYIYRQVIGLTEEEIADLEGKGVIGELTYDWAGPRPDYLKDR